MGSSLAKQKAQEEAAAHEAAQENELEYLRSMRAFRARHPTLFGNREPHLYTVNEAYRAVRYPPVEYVDAYDGTYSRLPDTSWRDSYIRVSIPVASTLVPASIRASRGKPSREASVANMYPDIALSRQLAPEATVRYSTRLGADKTDTLSLDELARLELRSANDDEVRSDFSRNLLRREILTRYQLQRLHLNRHVKVSNLQPHQDPYPNR